MQSPDELRRENEALRRRAARLDAAVRRIGASLDAAGDRVRRGGRSQAELPGAVGRQLLVPLTSIESSTAAALDAPDHVGAAGMLQLFRHIDKRADHLADLLRGGPEARRSRAGARPDREGEGPRPGLASPAANHAGAAGAELTAHRTSG